MSKFGKYSIVAAIVLLIATAIIIVTGVHAFTPDSLPFPVERADEIWICYCAYDIGKPSEYWVLTDPEDCIIEAIEHAPENHYDPIANKWHEYWVRALANETTFIYQVYEHGSIWNIEYAGQYYTIECAWKYVDLDMLYQEIHIRWEYEKQAVITGSLAVSGAWIALGTLWITKRSKPEVTS